MRPALPAWPALLVGLEVALAQAGCVGSAPVARQSDDDASMRPDGGEAGDHGGVDPGDAADAAPTPWTCPGFAPLTITGNVQASAAQELSGLAASADHPGVLWAHNDDDGPAVLVAFDPTGAALGIARIDAAVTDFEDLFRADGVGGPDLLYLADTGDNDLARAAVRVLRIAEPAIDPAGHGQTIAVADVTVFDLQYPGGEAHDAEALLVEPGSGDLYLFTKVRDGDPASRVYRAGALASQADGGSRTLELVLDQAAAPGLTGAIVTAALSPDRGLILLGFRDDGFRLWPRVGSIADALREPPCAAPRAAGQVEAATFSADGAGYYMVAEGDEPPITLAPLSQDNS